MSTAVMDINGWQSILERLSESCKASVAPRSCLSRAEGLHQQRTVKEPQKETGPQSSVWSHLSNTSRIQMPQGELDGCVSKHCCSLMVASPCPRVSSVPPIMLRGVQSPARDRVVRVTTWLDIVKSNVRLVRGFSPPFSNSGMAFVAV
jgi:hypothetical protein